MAATLLAAALFLLATISASPLAKRDFGPQTIFSPPSAYNVPRTLYGRSLLLNDVRVIGQPPLESMN